MTTIKLFDPHVGKDEENSLIKSLKSHFWASGTGTGLVAEFENSFQKYVKSDACIAVNNGTSALNLALSLANLSNKEVIVPSLTFVSTIHAILINGGKPIFADIDPKTLCIDVDQIKKLINKNTKLILPVHFAGMPCELNEIINISKNHGLQVIEDAAHAAGTTCQNKKIGKHGMAVCFSFHPVKNLAMPTGGLISINHKNSKKLKKILNARRWCGITNRKGVDYDVTELGWNYYMNEFSAAIGLVQLKKLDKMNSLRKKIARKYHEEIQVESKIPFSDECSYHLYWILVRNRKQFMKKMKEHGIETGIHYKPVHKMSMYHSKMKLPDTDFAGNHIVSIPIHPNLSQSDVEKIITCVNKFS